MKYLIIISILFSSLATFAQKSIILNRIHKDSVRFYIGFPKKTEEFNYLEAAQKFSTEKTGSQLECVELGRMILQVNGGESSVGEPSSTIFLLKIYDVDSLTGAPGILLTNEPLKVKNRANQIVRIDLRKYKMIIPGKEFFVGIQWLQVEENQRLATGMLEMYELAPGKRFRKVQRIYEPFVGMIKKNKMTSDAWVMTPEREWKLYTHNMPYMTDLAISAHIITN